MLKDEEHTNSLMIHVSNVLIESGSREYHAIFLTLNVFPAAVIMPRSREHEYQTCCLEFISSASGEPSCY